MRLKIILPTEIFLDQEIEKIIGESPSGEFCLLPRHIDYVTALIPGILTYYSKNGLENFTAIEGGVLIKQQSEVTLATRRAVSGALGELQQEVDSMLARQQDREKSGQTAMARLEAGFLRRFMVLSKRG